MSAKKPVTPRPPAARESSVTNAKKASRSPARKSGGRRVGRKHTSMPLSTQVLITGFFVVALAAALPTALMLAFALLPAFVALLTDRSPGRSATLCIGALNLAGTWPFLLRLWTGGHTVINAMQIILDAKAWLVIYSSAAVGWILYLAFPTLVAACMSMFAGHRVIQLRQQQKRLLEEWGPKVATNSAPPRH